MNNLFKWILLIILILAAWFILFYAIGLFIAIIIYRIKLFILICIVSAICFGLGYLFGRRR